jgi:hypothetical protein
MKCGLCKIWNIDRDATHVGTWGDGKPLALCTGCKRAGCGYDMKPIECEEKSAPVPAEVLSPEAFVELLAGALKAPFRLDFSHREGW